MHAQIQKDRDSGFVFGLAAGTLVGAGLAMWLVPRLASELRERATDAARNVRQRATERYQQASARVGDAVDELTRKGQGVERDANAAKTDRAAEIRKHTSRESSTRKPRGA
jgi:gas vesicle protein